MAVVKSSVDTNRQKIADIVPLDSPLSMYVEPTRLCNFKCFYCMHGTRGVKGGQLEQSGFSIKNMEMDLYEKLVKEIMSFPSVPKRVCFSGLGEPLMNKNLPKMIKMLRDAGFTGRIDVISNGSLLVPEVSDALIDAGISRIQISIQGLTKEKYKEVSDIDVEIQQLVDNVRYFYEHEKEATIYIKIIDSILEGEEDRKTFFDMFESICDTIYVEHLVVMQQQMGDHGGIVDSTRNLMGVSVAPREVCGVMFYFLQVNSDGETFPCSTPGLPVDLSMGCMRNQTLQDIWNGKVRNHMLRTNLKDGYKKIPACSECSSIIACVTSADDDSEYMDDRREEILEKLSNKKS